MAGDDSDSEGHVQGAQESRACMACRGTGQVISNLGGTPSTLACPWCQGSGVRVPGIDAQASWLERDGDAAAAPVAGDSSN